jgi:hypothetical protein
MSRERLSDERLSQILRSLPRRLPPPALRTRLRILASHERARRQTGAGSRLSVWAGRMMLFADNLMRPLALPFAGGVFSAVALFGMWVVPTYPVRAQLSSDVPTMLTTLPAVKNTMPIAVASGGDAVVDVMIDEQGRMMDYRVVAGAAILTNATLRRRLENTLLFTEFVPATAFGKPMISTVRLSLAWSYVDVKG